MVFAKSSLFFALGLTACNTLGNCLAGPKPQKQGLRQRRLDKTLRLGYRSVDASVRPDLGETGQRPEDRGQ